MYIPEIRNSPYFRTGSSVICSPPSTDTGTDIVCIYNSEDSARLQANGYVISPHGEYPNTKIRACYRKYAVNVIAVCDEHDYELWVKATDIATDMNLLEKRQRVILFQFITEGCIRDTGIKY